jgi:hypothetical protein
MRSLLADLCFWFATPAKPPSAFAWFRQRGHSMRAPVLAQIDSSEMRGSDDEEASRVVRAGTPTAGRAWACGLAVGWPLVWFCVRVGG